MARQWFYTHDSEQQGPVSAAELKELAARGKLSRQDLVWAEGMSEWKPAGRMKGLFAEDVAGSASASTSATASPRPALPQDGDGRNDEDSLPFSPRYILTGIGGFIAALGIAFTVVAQSPLALGLTVGGLALAILSLFVEIGRLFSQAVTNLGFGIRVHILRHWTASGSDLCGRSERMPSVEKPPPMRYSAAVRGSKIGEAAVAAFESV